MVPSFSLGTRPRVSMVNACPQFFHLPARRFKSTAFSSHKTFVERPDRTSFPRSFWSPKHNFCTIVSGVVHV